MRNSALRKYAMIGGLILCAVFAAELIDRAHVPWARVSHHVAQTEYAPFGDRSVLLLDGSPIRIRELAVDGKLLLMVGGSETCNISRSQIDDVDRLESEYDDRLKCIWIYTVEAHPVDTDSPYGGSDIPEDNKRDDCLFPQHKTLQERMQRAHSFSDRLPPGSTILMDDMDDSFWLAAGMTPNFALLLTPTGEVLKHWDYFDHDTISSTMFLLSLEP